MPLNTAYLPKVDGLQTENSAINSDPRALADCIDVVSDTDDTLESRHGHPTAEKGATEAAAPVDLYKYSTDTEKIFVATYKTAAGKFQFKTIKQAGDEITSSSTESVLREIDNKSTTKLSQVSTRPAAFLHDERLLFLTDYGLFFRNSSAAADANAVKVDFPVIRTGAVESVWLPSDTEFNDEQQEARHWLVPGFQVNVKIVTEIEAKESNKGERLLESPPSRIYEVKNFNLENNANDKRTSNTLVRVAGLSFSHEPSSPYKVKFYRTPQFKIGEEPITEYFYAGEGRPVDIEYVNNGSTSLSGSFQDSVIFKPDGTRMYVLCNFTFQIDEYSLSTAWDITTATRTESKTTGLISGVDSEAIAFNNDGTVLYIYFATPSGTNPTTVKSYALGVPYDITSMSNISSSTFTTNFADDYPSDIKFSPDGKYMFLTGGLVLAQPPYIRSYSLSTPWDITTANLTATIPISSFDSTPKAIAFDPNGEFLILLGGGVTASKGTLYVFKLSTKYDLTTATYFSSLDISGTGTSVFFQGLYLSPDGTDLYVLDSDGKKVYQFDVKNISGAVYLTTNDDIVKQLNHLYNDTSQGGSFNTNHIPIPAKNVTQFLNYYIYSNIIPPTVAQFGFKSIPKDGDTLSLRLSGGAGVAAIEKTLTFKDSPLTPSEIKIAKNPTSLFNDYIGNESDLAFRGLRSPPTYINRVIRIKPGSGPGEVEAYGQISSYTGVLANGTSAIIRVVPTSGGFDINKFPEPGVAAIVDTAGRILLLFSYSNHRTVSSSSGFIDFEGGVSAGDNMPNSTLTGDFYMYALNVENLQTTLDSTAGTDQTLSGLSLYYGDGNSYFSLLPCNNSFALPIASPAPYLNKTFYANGDGDRTVNPFYLGLLNRPQGKLLDDMAVAVADAFQNQFNDGGAAIITCSGGNVIENGVVTFEILDPTYEKVELKIGAGSVDAYEPQITSTYEEFVKSEKAVSAFVVSKENNPEIIPYGGTGVSVAGPYVTTKVGDPNKAIVACASTKDSVYVLKEDGIARVSIVAGALTPIIENIFLFDNTTFCQSSGSVQNLNDSIIFLAQDGVYGIIGSSSRKLSSVIENELKKALSQCRAANKIDDIRSFANNAKGLYGLHIPLAGESYVTYILNMATMRWTKWSNQFKGAVVDDDGRLTTLIGDINDNYWRQDKYTGGDPRNEADQVDDELDLSTGTAVDTELIRTISLTGIGTKVDRVGAKQFYYKHSDGSLESVTVAKVNANQVTVTFTNTPVAFNAADKLVVGVNSFVEFQPFTNGNPSGLKMFSGFHVHTVESVNDLRVSFRTEARSTYSVVKNFNTSPTDRTVYRCYIPLEAVRGRFLYRKVSHARPYETFLMPAQSIVFRDSGSERVNK